MSLSGYIKIEPLTYDAVNLAYSRGLITFQTCCEKLKELNKIAVCMFCHVEINDTNYGVSFTDGRVCCERCKEKGE